MIARKVQLFPNDHDARMLRRWCGLYRRMYNIAVARMLTSGKMHPQGHNVITAYGNIPKSEKARLLPTNIRKEAVREAIAAASKAPRVTSVKFKTLKRTGRALRMGQGSIVIVGDRIRVADSQKHKQRSKEMIRFDERFVKDINPKKAVQIEYSDGKWWLISVFDRPIEEPPKKKQIVALDPGVRTFQTTYSPDGASKKLGDRASCRIFRMMRYADRLSAFKDKRSKRKRQRLENRIGNIVTEMHWKIARELATEYETIIIPAFETQRMARKWKRKINKTVVRMMLRLAHYKFREKLEHVAKKLGSRVVVVTEEYTSKTCGRCGVVHDKLGGAKKFKCPNCEIRIDRDGNGARNICIKTVAQAAAMT